MFAIENQQNWSITSGQKSGPRSRKIAALVSEPGSEVTGSIPGRGKVLHLIFFFCDNECWLAERVDSPTPRTGIPDLSNVFYEL